MNLGFGRLAVLVANLEEHWVSRKLVAGGLDHTS